MLGSLSAIPSNINTYPPVLSELITHERLVYALSRPNPTPTTSLLNVASARRTRTNDSLGATTDTPWVSRSKLGEPDVLPTDLPTESEDAGRIKWSFWGRKLGSEKPLVTSGGGMLEVKPTNSFAKGSDPTTRAVAFASDATTARMSSESQREIPLPGPSPSSSTAARPPPSVKDDRGQQTASGTIGGQGQPGGPSAVSRFFGRLQRKTSAQRVHSVDAHDLELSADDFSFLAEVPSLSNPPPEKGIGDLLSMESGRSEEIASLESMLASKPTALPAPLAPPPKGLKAPSYSRTPSSSSVGSARFVPRMKVPAATDIDLLSGLEFDDDTAQLATSSPAAAVSFVSPPNAMTTSSPSNATSSAWEDFLASSQPPSLAPAQIGSNSPGRRTISDKPKALPATRPERVSRPAPLPVMETATFDDFDTPQAISTTTFDDFGDFSDFSLDTSLAGTTNTINNPFPRIINANRPAQNPISHPVSRMPSNKPPPLDHTPTKALLNEASAVKGRRWPAPPSPVAPNLDPPPRAAYTSGGFPFLSPPPPPIRPSSGFGSQPHPILIEDDLPGSAEKSQQPFPGSMPSTIGATVPPPAPAMQGPAFSTGSLAPIPLKTDSLSSFSPPAATVTSNTRPGLSAQDLSFFETSLA